MRENGTRGRHRAPSSISRGHGQRDDQRAQTRVYGEALHGVRCGGPDLVTRRVVDAESCRHLLQRDHDGDAGGEALDDGHGQVADVAAEAGDSHRHQHHARQQAHHQHAGDTVLVHDGHQHHGHRPRGPRDLDVGATEDRGDDPRNDGGDQSRLRTQAGGGTEGQRQRQRHDRDRESGHQVLPRLATGGGQVGPRREQSAQASCQQLRRFSQGGPGLPRAVGGAGRSPCGRGR